MDFPINVKTINFIKNKNKYYYSSYVNNSQKVFSFSSNETVNSYIRFMNDYKEKYFKYPSINADSELIFQVKEDLVLTVGNEEIESLMDKCSSLGLGLILIHSVEFTELPDSIDIDFKAEEIDIDYEELHSVNKLEYLFKL